MNYLLTTKLILLLLASTFWGLPVAYSQSHLGKIDPKLVECVVRIVEAPNTNKPATFGTGFLISKSLTRNGVTNAITYIVTAKHVLSDWNAVDGVSNWFDSVRIHLYPATNPPLFISLKGTNGSLKLQIIPHPEPRVDIALIAMLGEIRWNSTSAMGADFLLPFAATDGPDGIAMGDHVFALGYPLGFYSRNNNYPVAKSGYVASWPGQEFSLLQEFSDRSNVSHVVNLKGKLFLVDGLIVGGNSGGPVVVASEMRYALNTNGGLIQTPKPIPNSVIGLVSMAGPANLAIVYSSDYILDLINEFEKRIGGIEGNDFLFSQ